MSTGCKRTLGNSARYSKQGNKSDQMEKDNETTKLFSIIGMPAHHSLSPAIHNAAFRHFGINAIFLAFDVPKEKLKDAVYGMKAYGMKGMTLTSPHKEAVIKYVDRIDKFASKLGAVNTLINRNDHLFGYNTDSLGFIRSIEKFSPQKSDTYTIIGAGGAARAFAFGLMHFKHANKINIINRTISHAISLQNDAAKVFSNANIQAFKLGTKEANEAIAKSDFLINATNITLENSTETPVSKSLLKSSMVIFDANYVPLKNRFISEALAKGCITVNGIELLVNQGIVAFKLFTGFDAPYQIMKNAALKEIRKREKENKK